MSAQTASPKTQVIVGSAGLAIVAAVCILFWVNHDHRYGQVSLGTSVRTQLTGRTRGTVIGYTDIPMKWADQYGNEGTTSITSSVIQYKVDDETYETTANGMSRIGETVGVAYDPADPASAAGYGGGAWELRLMMIVGGPTMALCVVAIIVGVRGMIGANRPSPH